MRNEPTTSLTARAALTDFGEFMRRFDESPGFTFTKINHAFWEVLADIEAAVGTPRTLAERRLADRIAHRQDFFVGGFVDELLQSLDEALDGDDPDIHIGFELSAWPGDEELNGTPRYPERSEPVLERYRSRLRHEVDGLLLKRAAMSGEILRFLNALAPMRVVVVGPEPAQALVAHIPFASLARIPIHPSLARTHRRRHEDEIRRALDASPPGETCVLLQAGTLAPFWALTLRREYPDVRWVDGGLAFSIAAPEDLLTRPWGRVYRRELLRTYRALGGREEFSDEDVDPWIGAQLAIRRRAATRPGRVAFVEDKPLERARADEMLEISGTKNHWANEGPLWELLCEAYARHLRLPAGLSVMAFSSGGTALEALAALHAVKAGRPLRWMASAFGFLNTSRGLFHDALFVDCNAAGVMAVEEVARQPLDAYDGIVVTNPFGIFSRFDRLLAFARETGKPVLLDNAAGLGNIFSDHPYQAFSLHHTKPYGHGEGGLIVVPEEERELVRELTHYLPAGADVARHWVGNGKLAEVPCAHLLARLERAPEWGFRYRMQSGRVAAIARRAGLRPLHDEADGAIAMSIPVLAPRPVPVDALQNPHLVLGKYYRPVPGFPMAERIYAHIVNVPSHPDVARVGQADLLGVLAGLGGAA